MLDTLLSILPTFPEFFLTRPHEAVTCSRWDRGSFMRSNAKYAKLTRYTAGIQALYPQPRVLNIMAFTKCLPCARSCAAHITETLGPTESSPPSCEVGFIIPILQKRKLRLKEVTWVAQGHPGRFKPGLYGCCVVPALNHSALPPLWKVRCASLPPLAS